MPKKPLLRSSVYAYHVTARSNNRECFYLPIPTVWEIMCMNLFTASVAYNAKVHAFVLMSNHFHLLVSTPDENLDEVMRYFIRETSKEINRYSDRVNHVFGGRYKWSLIQNPNYFALAYAYIYQNPVRAGICACPDVYKYSSLQWLIGQSKLLCPIRYPVNSLNSWIPNNPVEQLQWLKNFASLNTYQEEIRLAFRRSVFNPNFGP